MSSSKNENVGLCVFLLQKFTTPYPLEKLGGRLAITLHRLDASMTASAQRRDVVVGEGTMRIYCQANYVVKFIHHHRTPIVIAEWITAQPAFILSTEGSPATRRSNLLCVEKGGR